MRALSDSKPPGLATTDHRAEISLTWLTRLRWGALAGQLATIGVARILLGSELPVLRLLSLVALLLASNVLLLAARRRALPARALCRAALTVDVILLTGLLYASGGAYNPFSVLYLVYITLAAVVLGARFTWFLTALSVCCYGLLFLIHVPIHHLSGAAPEMRLHLQGMWLAFCVAAVLTAWFVVRLSLALERRDTAIAEMREQVSRQERLASVTTLAAGAAHELGTPLATMAVAAGELEQAVRRLPAELGTALVDDAALIRSEIARCRAILDRLATDVGQPPGETPVEMSAHELLAAVVAGLAQGQRARLRTTAEPEWGTVRAPRAALLQVAHSLVKNALEAGEGPVELTLQARASGFRILVRDEGAGMPPDVLARVGEPFFSTKLPGSGLGLGVFITRSLCEQMGGRLTLESSPGRGTTAAVEIPWTGRRSDAAAADRRG